MRLVKREYKGKQRVYDIEVADVHNFFANGINVHNCATDGGVSVIDGPAGVGTVVDITWSSYGFCKKVHFDTGNRLFIINDDTTVKGRFIHVWDTIPSVDVSEAGGTVQGTASAFYGSVVAGSTLDLATVGQSSADTQTNAIVEDASGHGAGVAKYAEDTTTPANGMVAYLTNSYNTGWLKGGIRRAVICEAEGTTETLTATTITDRSVKASSLTVNGSLTRSPVATGAELQGISGYSAVNYMSQAYSADLDFGTGDFYICGWINRVALGSTHIIVARTAPDSSGVEWSVRFNTSNELVFTGDGGSVIVSTAHPITAKWDMFVITRVSGVVYLYINDVLRAQSANTTSFTNASAILGIGVFPTTSPSLAFNGSLALLRIGSGSLSAAQIAKMYREELALFQPGSKCTIQGASSAVTALAYNERYNKLLVGTSAGVTCFDNLAVDESFYTNTGSIKALASDNKINLAASTAEVKVKKA